MRSHAKSHNHTKGVFVELVRGYMQGKGKKTRRDYEQSEQHKRLGAKANARCRDKRKLFDMMASGATEAEKAASHL